MSQKLSPETHRVMAHAQREAMRLNHDYIGTEHVLIGLLSEENGTAANILRRHDIGVERARTEVERLVASGSTGTKALVFPFTPRAKRVLELAVEEARDFGDRQVGTGHMLLGLLREDEGTGGRILSELGVDPFDIRAEIQRRYLPMSRDQGD